MVASGVATRVLVTGGAGFIGSHVAERGMEHVLTWLEERKAADSVDAAHAALVARGLAR